METPKPPRTAWKAIHIPNVSPLDLASPHSPSSPSSLVPLYATTTPWRTASPPCTPDSERPQRVYAVNILLRNLEGHIRSRVIKIVETSPVPNLQQISLVCLSCSVLISTVCDAISVGVGEDLLPLQSLLETLREFNRLVSDIASHDLLWQVTNASAIRAELAGLLRMLYLLFQELDVLGWSHFSFLGPTLRPHHIRLQENLARWDSMLEFAARTDRIQLSEILYRTLSPEQLRIVLETAPPVGNVDVLTSINPT